MPSIPQTYTVSDFIEWQAKKQLVLAPEFQRGSVWSPSAKVFLIDTILNDLPLPQVYFRTKLNPQTQTTVREVVDGQQRLRAILEFASGNLKLTSKSPNFKGKTYQDLAVEDQEQFLSYRIPVVQLVNASDAEVLEVFARLNSYSVKVTPAELRHAEFSEPVKWAIYDAARHWSTLWGDLKVVSTRDTVRLKHTTLIAEMFIALDRGLGDGGETQITRYYKVKSKEEEDYFSPLREKLDEVVSELLEHTKADFAESTFYDAPNFLVLFAAVAFLKGYVPISKLSESVNELSGQGVDWEKASVNLSALAQAVDDGAEEHGPYAQFVSASKSTLHRVSSRKPRFEAVVRAISADVAHA
ncbi:hypothetical protein BBF93_00170 [Hyphomonas sp. CACIAM 19H1]|uniref:DUF262 domain-containing protein n=1 Tax=Hyphomonas sp. CACIAM 19H1 TaxID=1873716 RepID=UPI000DED998D|nr:DUF262 domain-containing protein [Hyphomonas sp. CACIAM 19H1]AXE62799.1 hypothetical protein BBF93_00170 [Hyphomonas sp. CACIAM 19H1]